MKTMYGNRCLYTLLPLFGIQVCAAKPVHTEKPANVLFIAVDDLRPALGCYGDSIAQTPHIDALAREATLFRRAYCQQAVSGPTRASLLTGLRPEEIGVTELGSYMRALHPDVITLPEAFRRAGYETCNVGKIFHGTKNSLDERSWSIPPKLYQYTRVDEYQLPDNKTGKKARAIEFSEAPDSLYFDVRIRDEALKRLSELSRSQKPFFLSVGFLKPHLPFCAPVRFRDLYAEKDFGLDSRTQARPIDAPAIAHHNSEELRGYTDIPDLGPLSAEQEKELRRAYYACVSFTDEQIGMLLDKLKELGLYDNTLIVLWGDHGYHLGEQELWCKSTTYEAACRAPLIIREPRQYGSRTVDTVIEFLDIYPTMLDLCNIQPEMHLSGKSLCPQLNGRKGGRSYAISQFQRPYPALTDRKKRRHMGYVIRDARWSYTEWRDLEGRTVACELYDLKSERQEQYNLYGKGHHSVTRRLARNLHRILDRQRFSDGLIPEMESACPISHQ